MGPPCIKSLFLEQAKDMNISKIVMGLKKSSSSDPDNIPTKVIKFVRPSIIFPLMKLLNLPFQHGIFPSSHYGIRVIHIRGTRNDPPNYR